MHYQIARTRSDLSMTRWTFRLDIPLMGNDARPQITLMTVEHLDRKTTRHKWIRQVPFYSCDTAHDWRNRDYLPVDLVSIPDDVFRDAIAMARDSITGVTIRPGHYERQKNRNG